MLLNSEHKTIARVNLYADEIKPLRNPKGEQWMYFGILAIQEEKSDIILDALNGDRKITGYDHALHFTEISRSDKFALAARWLDRVVYDKWTDPMPPSGQKGFHFHILGINLDNLQNAAFGGKGNTQLESIYNRFFRSAISYTLLSRFGNYDVIAVTSIFHHAGHMQNNEIFDWHSISKISRDYEKISFDTTQIKFITADHTSAGQDEKHAHFIQLTDLILGGTRECLDFTTKRQWGVRTAKIIRPLIASLVETERHGERKRFSVDKRCSVEFFPSRKLSADEVNDPTRRAQSTFYTSRRLLLPPGEGDVQQLSMFD